MSTQEDLLQHGIAAARAGQREEARALLVQVVQADERNEQAWLWLAGVVDDPEDMRTCLENVLDLNPGNVKAQQGLAWIETRYGRHAAREPGPEPDSASDAPEHAASYTGPTAKLASETAPTTTASPPPAAPAPAEAAAPPENPCPYCGTPTTPSQQYCTQCRNSLMIRAAPREQRSVPTTILGWLWCIGGVVALLIGLLIAALLFAPQGRVRGAAVSRELLLGNALGIILGGLLYLAIGRGMLRRARWAYIVHWVVLVLNVIIAVFQIALGGALFAGLSGVVGGSRSGRDAQIANVMGTILGVTLFCLVAWVLTYVVLTILSHRDFYGAKMRFLPEVDITDHMGHYNNGVAYKNRGMWYMAAREWEAAVSKAPHDLNYLHALGLAYVQIKRLYPQSTQYLLGVRHLLASRKAELYARAPELERLNLL